jgi:hypothetical protein
LETVDTTTLGGTSSLDTAIAAVNAANGGTISFVTGAAGTITLSGNYGGAATHGDALDFTTVNLPFSIGDYAPSNWEISELVQAGNAAYGYQYNYCPGPTLAAPTQKGGVLQIFGSGAGIGQGGTELTQGSAYSSFTPSLNGAILRARFWFVRL